MKNRTAVLIATWFYSGLIRPIGLQSMAGTYGSFFSIPFCLLALFFSHSSILYFFVILILIYLIGLWSIPITEKELGTRIDWRGQAKTKDQNQIVIDEVLGMLVSCLPLIIFKVDYNWKVIPLIFVLFRFFDIIKIPPTRFFDRMKNAHGVLLDDFIAGVYAAICLSIFLVLSNP